MKVTATSRAGAPGHRAPPEFSRLVPADSVGAGGIERVVEASSAERRALAVRLGVPDVLALSVRFTLARGGDGPRGEIVAEGALTAILVRECVVSLEAFEMPMATAFRVRFVQAGTERDDDLDPEADDEVPYEGGAIDLGEAAAEQLALELDPYPRRPGVVLAPPDDDVEPSPFAVLRRDRGVSGSE